MRRPLIRPGTVRRSRLIERLAQGDSHPIVSVVAPASYGKTTLLSQWAERSGQPVAWVSIDKADNDPKALLTAAELRLLPMLTTHLSFPEIATEVFLSPNTVKSTVHSVYRKLGTSSCNQAVARLRDLGLIEA